MVIVPSDLLPPGADEVEEPAEGDTAVVAAAEETHAGDTGVEVADDADAGPEERLALLTVCENGFGKRTPFHEYRTQARGGMGIINIRATKRNGPVVSLKAVAPGDDIVMITQQGMVVRSNAGTIKQTRRAAQGVRLISLKESDRLVSLAVVEEDDRNTAAATAAAAPAGGAPAEPAIGGDKLLNELIRRADDAEGGKEDGQ
jgi:DNA gyrase subunit A